MEHKRYLEQCASSWAKRRIQHNLKKEKQLKGWNLLQKLKLIEKVNIDWKDLYSKNESAKWWPYEENPDLILRVAQDDTRAAWD